MYKKAILLLLLLSAVSFAQSNQTAVCGNLLCESGEYAGNCCTDCPDSTGSAGAVSGGWYCVDSNTMARTLSVSSYVCNNQTRLYEWVTVNSTESQACPPGESCSGGRCVYTDNTSQFYWNLGWLDLDASTSGTEDAITVSPGQAISGRFAYTLWNGPNCNGGCDCIDEIVLGLDGDPVYCFNAGIPWCYPGSSGEASFSFNAPTAPGTYSLRYLGVQAYTCEEARSAYRSASSSRTIGKLVVSGASCTDSDGGKDYSIAGKSYSSDTGVEGRVDCCKSEYSDYMGDSVAHVGPGGGPCVAEGKYLYEAVCGSSGVPTTVVYECPSGCKGGVCVPDSVPVCKDSDGGVDVYNKGVVSYKGASYEDYCLNVVSSGGGAVTSAGGVSYSSQNVVISVPARVFEYSCGADGVESGDYVCSDGCSDGACKKGALQLSVSADKSSYLVGDSVRIDAKAAYGGNLVDAYVKGYVKRPDGSTEDLYFSDPCPKCPPGAVCAAVICADAGLKSAFYTPTQPGTHSIVVKASYESNYAESSSAFSVAGQPSFDFSISADRSSYSPGDEVRISAKASSAGALVDAYVTGVVVRPDGRTDELVFAKEACVRKPCPAGQACAAVEECPVRLGLSTAVYRPQMEGGYYVKATASYGGSVSESYAKFAVGLQKKVQFSAWLGSYKHNAGDTVRIFAKLTDASSGSPVDGAEVYARVYWAGNVRPYANQIVGIEPAAAIVVEAGSSSQAAQAKKLAVGSDYSKEPPSSASGGQASSSAAVRSPSVTGYAVAGIASSIEKQVASGDAGITYEEYQRINRPVPTAVQTEVPVKTAVSVGPQARDAQVQTSVSVRPMPPVYIEENIKLVYDPSTGYYEGEYGIPADARSGEYKVGVFANSGGQQLHAATSFSVGGDDYVSFEGRAMQAASEGKYGDCKDYFLKAAQDLAGSDQRRMFLDIEKAGICARLGDLPNSFYSEVGKIVQDAASAGNEKYVLYGIASQYYELGGDYRRSRELLEMAAEGLGGLDGVLASTGPVGGGSQLDYSLLSKLVLAKYHSLLGNGQKAVDYYRDAASMFSASTGSDAYLYALFSAKLYAKAGDIDKAREQYLLAAEQLSSMPSTSSEFLAVSFLAGDAYEKAGEAEKARGQYQKVVSSGIPGSYGSSESFFAYSAVGRSYERLGEKEKAKDAYAKGLERLLLKQDSESSYFAAGLSGYLGDYAKAKELCRKHFEASLSEESSVGKLTFMNAYCYSVLGDSVRAKKGCDLNSVTPQGETVVLEYLLEPLPPPVSYCSQSSGATTSACGNGIVDAGETSENCCADTGCAFGDSCSKALNKCVKPAGEIPPERILEVLLKLEDARMKLDTLEAKARAISKYYAGTDKARSDAWGKAAGIFGGAKAEIDSIKSDLKANRENMTEANLESIRQKLEGVRKSIKEAVDAILEAV